MHIVGPALDAAFEHRLERLVGGVVAVERQIVAEHEEAVRRAAQQRHQVGQALDVLAVDLDELQRRRSGAERRVDRGVRGLDQRGLAHAARAPQQRVVGRQAAREALGVLDRRSRTRSMPLSSAMSTRLTRGTGASRRPSGCQTKASAAVEVGRRGRRRREPLERRRRCAPGIRGSRAAAAVDADH